jgi:hypothetical protein
MVARRTAFDEAVFPAAAAALRGEGVHVVLGERPHDGACVLTLYVVAGRDEREDGDRLRQDGYALPVAPQMHLFCGSTVLGDDFLVCSRPRGHRVPSLHLPLHPVLNLGSDVSSLSFHGLHCAVVVPQGCFLLGLRSAADCAAEMQEYCDRSAITIAPLTPEAALARDDDESMDSSAYASVNSKTLGNGAASAIALPPVPPPEPTVRCSALVLAHTAVNAATSWAGGVAALVPTAAVEDDDDGRPASNVSLVAFKQQQPMLLSVAFSRLDLDLGRDSI